MISLSPGPATARCIYKLSASCASCVKSDAPASTLKFRTPKMCTNCYNQKARTSWTTRKSSAARRPSPSSQLVENQLLKQVNKSLLNIVTTKMKVIKELTAQLEEAKNTISQSQLSRSGNLSCEKCSKPEEYNQSSISNDDMLHIPWEGDSAAAGVAGIDAKGNGDSELDAEGDGESEVDAEFEPGVETRLSAVEAYAQSLSFIGGHLKNNEALMLSLKNSMYDLQEHSRRRQRCVYCPPCVECQVSDGSDSDHQSTTYDERQDILNKNK